MSPRRSALVLVAALCAVACAFGAPAARASSKPTICVALVVDGRALGSNVSTGCAKVPRGATGVDVLESAGHRIGFRDDGLICAIDGLPKTGCASVDDTHYWAYFHRAPGATSWTYSTEGASTYQPVNDSTEGWVYDNGTSLTPENVPYGQICKSKAKPTPSPTPTPHPTATHHRTATPATPTASAPPAAETATTHRHHHPHHQRAGGPRDSSRHTNTVTTPTTAVPTPTPSISSAALAGTGAAPSRHHVGRDVLVVALLVAAFGAAGVASYRRTEH